MEKSNVNLTLDENLKNDAQKLFESLDLELNDAVTLFLKASLKKPGILSDIYKLAGFPNDYGENDLEDLIRALDM